MMRPVDLRFQGYQIANPDAWQKGLPGMDFWSRWQLRSTRNKLVRLIRKDPTLKIMNQKLDKLGLDVSIAPYYDAMEGPADKDTFLLTAHAKGSNYSEVGWYSPHETIYSRNPHEVLISGFLLAAKQLGAKMPFLKQLL